MYPEESSLCTRKESVFGGWKALHKSTNVSSTSFSLRVPNIFNVILASGSIQYDCYVLKSPTAIKFLSMCFLSMCL